MLLSLYWTEHHWSCQIDYILLSLHLNTILIHFAFPFSGLERTRILSVCLLQLFSTYSLTTEENTPCYVIYIPAN